MDSWRGARPNACRRRTRDSDRLLADRCLDPPTPSASPARLLSQPTVLIHLAAALAVWALGLPAQHWRARWGLEVTARTALSENAGTFCACQVSKHQTNTGLCRPIPSFPVPTFGRGKRVARRPKSREMISASGNDSRQGGPELARGGSFRLRRA